MAEERERLRADVRRLLPVLAVPFYGTSSQRSMDDKQKFPAVLYGSLLFSGLFYIVVGVGCSLLYNQRGRAMGC